MDNITEKIKKFGPITFVLYIIFKNLNWLSPSHYIIYQKGKIHDRMRNMDKGELYIATKHLVKKVDIYILICIAIESLLVVVTPKLASIGSKLINSALLILLIIRLIEIVQININIALFDALKTSEDISEESHSMASPTRSVITMTLNYIELFIIFGLLYFISPGGALVQETGTLNYINNFYYSIVVQLTSGFENIHPTGWFKILTIIQMSIGIMFIVIIIARVFNLLPTIRSVVERNQK
jgi:hypothetical protein